MIKVNGTKIPTPSEFTVDIADIDGESNRNAKGELIRDRIAVKRKLNMNWKALSPADMKTLLNAVSGVFFTVEYPDPMTGGLNSITAYVGDRSAPMYRNIDGNILWEGLSMNFIQK